MRCAINRRWPTPRRCSDISCRRTRPIARAKCPAGGSTDDPATDTDFEWSLVKANVLEAWRLFGARPPGAGVRVGHPDTGYTLHPELADPAGLLVSEGYDYDDDDPDPPTISRTTSSTIQGMAPARAASS